MDAPIAPGSLGRRSLAAAIGSIWGLATYGVLWEGTPVEATRAFVESTLGTLVLLPSRIVIWSILGTESLLGRTFDLSTNYAWIAPAAAVVGAVIVWSTTAILGQTPRLRRRGR